jgi:hypothetical protein
MINEQIKVHHSISQHFTSLDRRERIATSMSSNQPETPPSIDQLQFISENVTRNTTSDCLIFFLYSDNEANVSVGTLLENGTAEGVCHFHFHPLFVLIVFFLHLFYSLISIFFFTVTWRDSAVQLYTLQWHCDFCSVCAL